MRLYQIGLALIFAAVIIPIILFLAIALQAAQQAGGRVIWGGAVVVFPFPIALVFGNEPSIISALSWIAVALFIVFLVLAIIWAIRWSRARQ